MWRSTCLNVVLGLLLSSCTGAHSTRASVEARPAPEISTAAEADSARMLTAIYTAVLQRAVKRYPAHPGLPVALDAEMSNAGCAPHCVDTALVRLLIPSEVIQQLKSSGLVQSTCRPPPGRAYGCADQPGHVYVRLGLPFALRVGFRVKPAEERPGVPWEQAAAAIPDSAAVEVQYALDLLVHAPCPANPASERCRFPDVTTFRYFVRAEPDGHFRVVTSMTTGTI